MLVRTDLPAASSRTTGKRAATVTILTVLALVAFETAIENAATAQEFRIYTRVSDMSPATPDQSGNSGKSVVIARSLSLFRAGKAYDYIDSLGEVVIFEPTRRKFTILNGSTKMAATVDFDELNQLVKIAERETRKYIAELEERSEPSALRAVPTLKFQLAPTFEKHFDAANRHLTLSSRHFRYDVQCAEAPTPEAVQVYLNYADWTAKLNYILHPQSLHPAIRMLLNQRLRELKQLPVKVELQADFERRLHLRAEHKLHWNLDKKDRGDIRHWESILHEKSLRHVPLREYQRTLLLSQSTKRR